MLEPFITKQQAPDSFLAKAPEPFIRDFSGMPVVDSLHSAGLLAVNNTKGYDELYSIIEEIYISNEYISWAFFAPIIVWFFIEAVMHCTKFIDRF